MPRFHARSVVALTMLLAGCGGPPTHEEDGGRADSGGVDAGPAECVLDRECQDTDWCNGEERCMPGATDADERGCVAAPEPRCEDGYVCEAAAMECRTDCLVELDADGDGHRAIECGGDDCDDHDANRYPGNVEICDGEGHDEDCNDETFGFLDADGDGSATRVCCNAANCGDDCNDADSTVNPRAGDVCDGVDNDCSGAADEGCPCSVGETRECGSEAALMRIGLCRPGGQVCVMGTFTDRCVGAIEPGEEVCDGSDRDEDCDGTVDEGVRRTYYRDADGDGYGSMAETQSACSASDGWASNAFDCDDSVAPVNPGVPEVCNGRDDDCDSMTDEGLLRPYFADTDGDGFGADATMSMACSPPTSSHVERGGDCDDTRRNVSPVGFEACNGLDDDCDAMTDEGVLRTFYRDADGDGVGGTTTETACAPSAGYVGTSGDCDDANAARYPGRFEACNGIDDDCNGAIDPGCACTDGSVQVCGASEVGACARGSQLCVGGTWGTECIGEITPVPEVCNTVDDDCDGAVDDGVTVTGCLGDGDSDGFGAGAPSTQCRDATRMAAGYCPSGYTIVSGDCNDANASIRPSATEVCNGLDDDCDGVADDGVSASPCYVDADGDGRGTGTPTTQCRDAARAAFGYCPAGFTNLAGDCNDAASAIRPGATEACNGVDDDCDGAADDGFSCVRGATRTGSAAYGSCASVAGTFTCNATCTAELFTPILTPESCNGADDDCNGVADETFACVRSTTGLGCTTTCGTPGTQSCSATCTLGTCAASGETCNACDDDRDGAIDEGLDADGVDPCTYGQMRACTTSCGSAGTQRCRPDCAGWEACRASGEGPSVSGTCNACDDDLDGRVDEGFACEQNRTYACSVPVCGTPGQLICGSSCTYVSPTCASPFEYCNYCDDDRDGTFLDDSGVAGASDFLRPDCCAANLYSGATCRVPNEAAGDQPVSCPMGEDDFYILCGHVVNLTTGGASAENPFVWFTNPVRVGFGTVRVDVVMEAWRTTAYPGAAWEVMIAEGPTLPTTIFFNGNLIYWYEYNNIETNEPDQIRLHSRTPSTFGPMLGFGAVPAARRLDSTDPLSVPQLQPLTVEIQVDDPATATDESELRAVIDGTVVARTSAHRRPTPGQNLFIGVRASHNTTYRMRTRFSAFRREDYGSGDCDGAALWAESSFSSTRTCD